MRRGPRQPYAPNSAAPAPRTLELDVFAGRSGSFALYEDAGEGFAYRRGGFARTPLRWSQARRRLTIERARGRFAGQRRRRAYRVRFVGVSRPRRVRLGGHAAAAHGAVPGLGLRRGPPYAVGAHRTGPRHAARHARVRSLTRPHPG